MVAGVHDIPARQRLQLALREALRARDTIAEVYFPVCVQAAGAGAPSATFAALFVQQQAIVPRQFTATGPVANADIDAVVQAVMQAYPTVRHAALAIVHGTKLAYAHGYTLAEPDWPIVQPTTFFRLASVSKVVTALAVFQLLETGALDAATSVQDILELSAPGGGPSTPGFASVTIQSLLEHTSGLNDDSGWDVGTTVVAAFNSAGIPASVPVTQDMTDSFIAGLTPETPPGEVQQYRHCGYYLLSRVVAKLAGTVDPITAYQDNLLDFLGITRIRAAVDLLADQPGDEARYQAASFGPSPLWLSDLQVGASLMTPDQPTVAVGYGTAELAISQGAGGLSGAATDVVRLVAILLDTKDNPALKRVTLEQMLSQGAVLGAAQYALQGPNGGSRAGFGLDGAQWQSPGVYYGQKGGLIVDAASVFEFDGEWGFVALFGSTANRPNNLVYPRLARRDGQSQDRTRHRNRPVPPVRDAIALTGASVLLPVRRHWPGARPSKRAAITSAAVASSWATAAGSLSSPRSGTAWGNAANGGG